MNLWLDIGAGSGAPRAAYLYMAVLRDVHTKLVWRFILLNKDQDYPYPYDLYIRMDQYENDKKSIWENVKFR